MGLPGRYPPISAAGRWPPAATTEAISILPSNAPAALRDLAHLNSFSISCSATGTFPAAAASKVENLVLLFTCRHCVDGVFGDESGCAAHEFMDLVLQLLHVRRAVIEWVARFVGPSGREHDHERCCAWPCHTAASGFCGVHNPVHQLRAARRRNSTASFGSGFFTRLGRSLRDGSSSTSVWLPARIRITPSIPESHRHPSSPVCQGE